MNNLKDKTGVHNTKMYIFLIQQPTVVVVNTHFGLRGAASRNKFESGAMIGGVPTF